MNKPWCLPCGERRIETRAAYLVDNDPMCKPCMTAASGVQVVPLNGEGQTVAGVQVGRRAIDDFEPATLYQPVTRKMRPAKDPEIETVEDAPRPPEPCKRGCGNPRHRGRCRGMKTGPLSEEKKAARSAKLAAGPIVLDTLECEEVQESEVPTRERHLARRIGRLGEIWNRLDKLEPGKRLKVANRDRTHLGTTQRQLRRVAEKTGRELVITISETWLYVRYATQEEIATRREVSK